MSRGHALEPDQEKLRNFGMGSSEGIPSGPKVKTTSFSGSPNEGVRTRSGSDLKEEVLNFK